MNHHMLTTVFQQLTTRGQSFFVCVSCFPSLFYFEATSKHFICMYP